MKRHTITFDRLVHTKIDKLAIAEFRSKINADFVWTILGSKLLPL